MKEPSAADLDRLEQAQEIGYGAWDARSDKQAVALAKTQFCHPSSGRGTLGN